MLDLQSLVRKLVRPQLLVRAARFGLDDYRRGHALRRLLGEDDALRPGEALMQLIDVEREMDEKRLAKAADYSIARHIELLTALMGEARLHADTLSRADAP